jgi:hypothetical protein
MEEIEDLMEAMKKERKESLLRFRENCYLAYDTVKESGIPEDDYSEREEIRTALRKVLALFELDEEYEKCKDLSWIMEKEFPGHDTTPDREFINNLEL